MNHQEFGIHIALAKYPLGEVDTYIKNIGNLYSNYKKNIRNYLNCRDEDLESSKYLKPLYNPKAFHLFSHFDVAFISIIDSYKFTQRVFEPRIENNNDSTIKNVSYQIISGSLVEGKTPTQINSFLNKSKRFLNIIQLKFTNGLVIGNGDEIFKDAIEKVNSILNDAEVHDYLIVDSFNWSELVLITSNENSEIITQVLLEIRRIKLKDLLNKDSIEKNSLYKKWNAPNIQESHVFNDTHSYIGVDYKSMKNVNHDENIFFESQIEWQIKPGHFSNFFKETEDFLVNDTFDSARFTYGKTDFIIKELTSDKFKSNQFAFHGLRNNSNLRKHIRRIKTKPTFKLNSKLIDLYNKDLNNEFSGPCETEKELERYLVDKEKNTAKFLRALNISRNIRKKIRKLIYNFNQGIQDPVLYIYYIDLYPLLKNFIELIEKKHKVFVEAITLGSIDKDSLIETEIHDKWHYALKTQYMEDLINKYIHVFEEALEDRLLNNYNFEDLNEFSLDINSASTSILSSYDAIVKICARCFRDPYNTGIVTRINDIQTVSNSISVNYNIDHINCPPLVFATLLKEILNTDKRDFDKKNDALFDKLKRKFSEIARDEFEEEELKLISYLLFNYFEIDLKKFYLTYFRREDLFGFWHWTYALQNTGSYSAIGNFDEFNFIRELFRLLLVSGTLNFQNEYSIEKLKCPIPELKSFWDRHYNRLLKIVRILIGMEEFKVWVESLKKEVFQILYQVDIPTPKDIKNLRIDNNELEFNYMIVNNVIREFFYKKNDGIYSSKNINLDDFVKNFEKYLQDQSSESNNLDKIQKISILSYFCLDFIFNKFIGRVQLLRRDYSNGKPVTHFLEKDSWFIDPMGGFFINCPIERRSFNHFNNCVLHLVWSLGVYLKKDQLFIE